MSSKQIYFYQYHSELNFPIYIQVLDAFEQEQDLRFKALVEQMKFKELNVSDQDSIEKILSENPKARMLTIKKASFKLTQQICTMASSDRYGVESVVPKPGYKVYRYRNIALMVYSFTASSWECGVTGQFCSPGDHERGAAKSVINRYLTWSLSCLGVIGFWGVPVDEGFVVLGQKEAEGEVVFIDLMNHKMLSMDGSKDISGGFEILRLDNALQGRSCIMRPSELLSFLFVKTSYLDPEGMSLPVRQMLNELSKLAFGKVYPRSSFQARVKKVVEL